MAVNSAEALRQLQHLQRAKPPTIVHLGESVGSQNAQIGTTRSSDVSSDGLDGTSQTPTGLEAELAHQKEHFSKLRLSYIEQITKEKFLNAITRDPPLLVEPDENQALEKALADEKAVLKAQKEEVANLLEELRLKAQELAQRHEKIMARQQRLSSLPEEIAALQADIEALRAVQPSAPEHPDLALPFDATMELLNSRETELTTLDAQIEALRATSARGTRELQRLENELQPLEAKKDITVKAAREARRRKEEGGGMDEMEEMGRWYRGSEKVLKSLVEAG